jgi:transposase
MFCHNLNLDGFGLHITEVVHTSSLLVIALASTAAASPCPSCGCLSHRVHSRYTRTVADLPSQDQPVAIRLTARRFRCVSPTCTTAIFCERIPKLLEAYARTTTRLTDIHGLIGLALGGEPGSRLAQKMAVPTSPDTILRRVKAHEGEPLPPPRFVGIDDWAWRKGQSYGTILIDLEQGRVIDILEGRDGSALNAWLKAHPGVEVITRDRWSAFAAAANEGAPQAKQVADRWHLLKNLREAVEGLLERFSPQIREALADAPKKPVETVSADPFGCATTPAAVAPEPLSTPPSLTPTPQEPVPSARRQAREMKQQHRSERFERVKDLRAQGQSIRQIARAMSMSKGCVIRYLRMDRCPNWNLGRQTPTQLDPFAEYIEGWIGRGGLNAADLHKELGGQGCRAGYDSVRRYLARVGVHGTEP